MTRPSFRASRVARVLAAGAACVLATCGGGGSGGGGSHSSSLGRNAATVALGDVSADQLSELAITFHELALVGPGGPAYLIQDGVDAPVTIDALSYEGTAAPIASRELAAGDYDTLSFKLTITAKDLTSLDVPVYPLFDPTGASYSEIATTFPLGPLNSFSIAEPAAENQPLLFMHVDVANSVADGEVPGSIVVGPRIFLSTRIPMALSGTVTEIDAANELFALEDALGSSYVVEPTDCTSFVAGFDVSKAGVGSAIVLSNLSVGDTLQMEGMLGVDPGCADVGQSSVRYHPHLVRAAFTGVGMALVNGIVQSVDTGGGTPVVTLLVERVTDVATGQPVMTGPGDVFAADFDACLLFTGLGEVHDLTGAADRLQPGEVLGVGVENFAPSGVGTYGGTPRCGFLQVVNLAGMIGAVDDLGLTLLASGTKKQTGDPHPAQAWLPGVGGPATAVALGTDIDVVVGSGSQVFVGPLSGWALTQLVDPFFDNQLSGPDGLDGQSLGAPCGAATQVDSDIDVGTLCAFVDHQSDGDDVWTIQRLDVNVSSDATQKYVSWEAGTPACTLPVNNAWNNNPCIAVDSKHREAAVLGDSNDPNWHNYAQTGAGAFGTSILNAGALVPGATVPPGSDTAGWDDVDERVLLGIDFDGDMYPFDDYADSCTGLEERVWVDLSQAVFFYFSKDSGTGDVDLQYLASYADFKSKVIALQAAQQAQSCGVGFHENAGFGFAGVIDKNSVESLVGGAIVPVVHAIDGRVFNGGCVAD
ncbi:MAG: hypothetical protein L6Q99_07085 [Planctomycetes bacterium]|nr:hypothetical protein [Planctomycetota bacterium]